ncbi:MAG TPA: SDR family NAD(P)-dependent oxidoreductase, partial [Chitinophagaceae bacterium]|nr:SDR family NAD(P)-dependent oxidoreductase [Chitinophagaceae bacterium]
MQKSQKEKPKRPPQKQKKQPGVQHKMKPTPKSQKEETEHPEKQKLSGKTAIITGGDSGIGRATAVAFAAQGARVVIAYLDEHEDAKKSAELVREKGGEALLISGDISRPPHCKKIVDKTLKRFGAIDILVNNAGVQYPQEKIGDISPDQLLKTFKTNVFSQFYLTQAALPHMGKGACIINTTSVTAYRGSPHLLDYSATKGAIVSFTRSLSTALASRGIRVNAVAPGPIWTPLIPATFPASKVSKFGSDVPL